MPTVRKYPCDSRMVSPSCCLEYRPTGTLWLILFFVVFPCIYLCGKVVGTFLTVLLRVLRGLCKLLLWDEEDYEEEAEQLRLERQQRILEKEELKRLRRAERAKKRGELAARKMANKSAQVAQLLANGAPRNGAKCMPTSDISESLNSECDADEQRVSPVTAAGPTIIVEKTLNNGHVTVPSIDTDVTSSSTLRHRFHHDSGDSSHSHEEAVV
ncbi:unnamed protein product [Cylicocyclus nassatus]|uniref:Uncharacterized protein n=1 Tax=Cylicocyclus nassatus TaxID=53992 RepID=A0AA36GFD8_CYLNA|nr:unnamed protein product [Cylicocyclus nassatus]